MIIYEEVLRAFQKEKVKYVLVGGIAFNILGGLRSTADLDILVEMSDRNLAKVIGILKKQGYRVRQPVDPMGMAEKKTREYWIHNKHMKAFNFYRDNDLKEVDIIIESPVSFEQAVKNIRRIRLGDIALPVISINDLIKMKKVTGRAVDKLDVDQLKEIKRMEKKK